MQFNRHVYNTKGLVGDKSFNTVKKYKFMLKLCL